MNKIKIVIIVLALLVLVGASAFVVLSKNIKSANTDIEPVASEEEVILKVDPEDLGLTLSSRADKKAVIMKMTKLSGISSIEYELTYESEGEIPRGVIGNIELKNGETSTTKEMLLGTCSKNVCKYYEGVKKVQLLLKLTYPDGSLAEAEEEYSF